MFYKKNKNAAIFSAHFIFAFTSYFHKIVWMYDKYIQSWQKIE